MPVRVSVRADQFKAVLASMEPLQGVIWGQLVMWMVINASTLPCDLQACCEIVNARSNEARRVVSELTGLEPLSSLSTVDKDLSTVDVYRRQNLSTVDKPVYRRQGVAFEGSPEGGLTLRSDRPWGIEPLSAEAAAEHARRVRREKQQRYRARKAKALSTVDDADTVEGRLVCARNSENQIPNTTHSLPSVGSESRAHTHEAEADPLAAGKLRGAKLAVLRRTGVAGCNGGDPRFVALVAAGVTDDELTWAGGKAVAKGAGFPYAVEALLRARQELAAGTPPSMPVGTPGGPERLSAWEARARELAGPSAIGYKPPS
jgi:hypothetical protein